MTWLERLGGQGFILALISGAGTFALCWAGRIDGNTYMLTTGAIVGGYITGRTITNVKGPPPPAP